MAVEAGFDAARRLAEALERSRAPQGEGLAAEARSPVPPGLAQAFRELMEAPQATGRIDPVGASDLAADSKIDPAAGPAGTAPAAAPLPTPAELLGLQFSVGMQLFEAKAGVAARDGVSQQVEEVLRSTN